MTPRTPLDLAANHRATIERRTPPPERRGFGLGAAIGCALILIATVFVMVTTRSPALFLVMAVVMCGCVMLLTDYAVGDHSGEVD